MEADRQASASPALEDLANHLELCLSLVTLDACDGFITAAKPIIVIAVQRVTRTSTRLSADETDDLVQDTFCKLFADNKAALKRFRAAHPGSLIAYLRAVAASVALDELSSRNAQKRGGQYHHDSLSGADTPAANHSAATQMDRQVVIKEIADFLASNTGIADRDTWIFWLYYRHGLTARAISEIQSLNLSQKGVEAVIQRITEILRDKFSKRPRAMIAGKGK